MWGSDALIPPPFLDSRTSKDPTFNQAAPHMVNLCYNLRILNRSRISIYSSEPTFLSSRGMSVVDYIFTSPDLLSKLVNFMVSSSFEIDHQPVLLSLLWELLFLTNYITPPAFYHHKIVCSNKTRDLYDQWTKSAEVRCLLLATSQTSSPFVAIQSYQAMIKFLSSLQNPKCLVSG